MALWSVAAVAAAGLLGACTPAPDTSPPPNVTAQENCTSRVTEKAQADGAKKLTTDVIDTVNAIRNMCGTKVRDFHVSRIAKVVQTDTTPGVSVDGCVQPSERQVTAQDFDRPICFQRVTDEDMRLNTNKKFKFVDELFLVQPSNDRSNFRPSDSFTPNEFVWRTTTNTGVKDFYYLNRPGKFQALMVRTLPKAEGDGNPFGDIELWCVDGERQLVPFGDMSKVIKRQDATGQVFSPFYTDQVLPTMDRWTDYQTAII